MNLNDVAYNTADVLTVGGLVITAVAAIWGVRKAIAMANRG